MNIDDIKQRIYRLRVKYNPTQISILWEKAWMLALNLVFIFVMLPGWGWFIWSLCGDGLNTWEKVGTTIGSYVVLILTCKMVAIPGFGCIPVKYYERDR